MIMAILSDHIKKDKKYFIEIQQMLVRYIENLEINQEIDSVLIRSRISLLIGQLGEGLFDGLNVKQFEKLKDFLFNSMNRLDKVELVIGL